MRGQVSLELIVVLAIFLAALSAWLGGIKALEGTIQLAMGTQRAEIAADKLAAAMNSVCVMGEGNIEGVTLSFPGNATASYNGSFVMHWGNREFVRTSYCPFSNFTAAARLSIENRGGMLSVR